MMTPNEALLFIVAPWLGVALLVFLAILGYKLHLWWNWDKTHELTVVMAALLSLTWPLAVLIGPPLYVWEYLFNKLNAYRIARLVKMGRKRNAKSNCQRCSDRGAQAWPQAAADSADDVAGEDVYAKP